MSNFHNCAKFEVLILILTMSSPLKSIKFGKVSVYQLKKSCKMKINIKENLHFAEMHVDSII